WTCAGIDQFSEPRRVAGISDDGEWAWVDGRSTGVAMGELTKVADPTKSDPSSNPKTPPANPNYKPQQMPGTLAPGMTQEMTTLDEGLVNLLWPAELSQASVQDFEYWVEGLIRRARRKAGL